MSEAIALPDSLDRQFDMLERRLWRVEALMGLAGGAGALMMSLTLEFVSDRAWDTPAWLRFVFALGGWTGFAVFAWQYGSRWIWGRRSVRALAVIVQKRYRRLGDRLLGIVELADPHARPSDYSPELCKAAIAQVAGEAAGFDFQEAAGERETRRYVTACAGLAAVVVVFATFAPQAARNSLLRWFSPMARIERYTFAEIEALPDRMVVAQGEAFDVGIKLAAGSAWKPGSARAHFDGQPAEEVAIRDGAGTFHFAGQTQARVLWVAVGDYLHAMRIEPEIRADLREVTARLTLPAYLQYPVQEQRVEGGGLAFLPGTKATIEGEAVRDLEAADMDGEDGKAATGLAVKGARFSTGEMLLEKERSLTFTWRDTYGLAGPGAATIHLTPREDAPPDVELRGLEAAIAVLPEETVPIDVAATDDYGVRRVSLAWQTAAPSPEETPGPVHELALSEGKPRMKGLNGHYDLSPTLLEIPEDTTVLVRGMAIDYFPYREAASTPIYKIHVLSRESHARLIHDQFEKLMAQLEEITRRQEAILQSGKAVRGQDAQKLANEESAQKLGEQNAAEKQTAAALKSLAGDTAQTLAEAMRNTQISKNTLKEWAKHVEQMNEIAANAMPEAAQSLDSAKDDAGQRPGKLDQALAQEQAILNAMREMAKQASQNQESLMAQTLAARLQRAAGTEREIADGFQKTLPDTIGLTPDQLQERDREALDGMVKRHAGVTLEAGRLQQEISRLFDRTSLNRYGDVAKEMDADKVSDGLTVLGTLAERNIGVHTIDTARYWSDQFESWAKRLDAQDDSKSQSGENGQGQPDPAQLQAMLALMQMRQQQEQLCEQTAVLEEQKKTNQEYPAKAQEAAGQQGTLRDQLEAMRQTRGFPVPAKELAPIGGAMSDATALLNKPETGQPTNAAQTDAVNLLDAVIQQQAKKSGQNAAALSAMMGMGGNGTGSTGGGTTDKTNEAIPGTREGEAPDERAIIQAGGVDNSQLPGEFRDAIEGYDRAIEQNRNP